MLVNVTVTNTELGLEVNRLRNASRKVGPQMQRRARDAAIPLKDGVVVTALQMGLHRAAAATSLSGTTVQVDSTRAPYAQPLNDPNTGEYNRHPVFGHYNTQVLQPARRFFDHGIQRGSEAAYREGDKVLDDIAREL